MKPVLRRIATIVVLTGLGVVPGLLLPRAVFGNAVAARGAVRLLVPSGAPLGGQWQAWANASLVPTVRGTVTVRATGCPGLPKVAGCVYTVQPRVVYLKRGISNPRGVLLHELGHVYDLTVLSDADRGGFRKIMGASHTRWWSGKRPLAEWFAEAYSWCARYARIVSVKRYAIYEYDPTPGQHRKTCSLIKVAARDRTPPVPPKAPPVVTGDPAPPAAPPGEPVVAPSPITAPVLPLPTVIAVPARTPLPTVTASPTATTPAPTPPPTPTPTKTPTPSPTPTPTP